MKLSLLVNPGHAGLQNQTREAVVEANFVSLLPLIGLGVSFPILGSVLGFHRPATS